MAIATTRLPTPSSFARLIPDVWEANMANRFRRTLVLLLGLSLFATVQAHAQMAVAPIGAFASGKGAGTVKALDALASFIGDWKKPKALITADKTITG